MAIQAYPDRVSLSPGETLLLRVSTDRPRFRVHFYRCGDGVRHIDSTGWLLGIDAPAGGAAEDWSWPPYPLRLPADWPSAVYLAVCEAEGEGEGEGEGAAGAPLLALRTRAALFVLRGPGRSGLLYKLPLATYHAYNVSGGSCFYHQPMQSQSPPGARVSLQRPGGGIGGDTWGAPDHYDASSPRQTFAHWDAPFIAWLLRQGYAPEFCTDLDLAADPGLCRRYRLLVGAGHDEYWTTAARDQVEAYVAGGGNAAFFGANLCWWRIHLVDDGRAMVCHQGGPDGPRDSWWRPCGAGRPEDGLAGVSYRHGGGWWDGPRDGAGYTVLAADHWVFAGTDLHQGEQLGGDCLPPLVGYECDGAPLASFDPVRGTATLHPSARETGTPAGLQLLAACRLDQRWQERPPRECWNDGEGIHAAVMAVFQRGGTVFTAGTTDWAQVLDSGQEPRLARITRNILDRLLADGGRDA